MDCYCVYLLVLGVVVYLRVHVTCLMTHLCTSSLNGMSWFCSRPNVSNVLDNWTKLSMDVWRVSVWRESEVGAAEGALRVFATPSESSSLKHSLNLTHWVIEDRFPKMKQRSQRKSKQSLESRVLRKLSLQIPNSIMSVLCDLNTNYPQTGLERIHFIALWLNQAGTFLFLSLGNICVLLVLIKQQWVPFMVQTWCLHVRNLIPAQFMT